MTQQIKRMAEVSRELGGFYVPAFEVRLDDERVPDGIVRDVLSVSYTDRADGTDTFSLTINNWDGRTNTFKYLGAPGSADSPFEVGRRVALSMGYQGHLEPMLVGEITALDASFPQSGQPTLTVSGENELRQFRGAPHNHLFTGELRRDSRIAAWLGRQPRRADQPGLDFRVEAPNADAEIDEDILMANEPDIVFLLRRAHVRGYTLVLRRPSEGEPYLYFGPPEQERQGAADGTTAQELVYELAWGSGLFSFQPVLDATQQLSEVTVCGFDRDSGEPVSHTARSTDLPGRLNADQTDVERAREGRREVFHADPRNLGEARARAEESLRNNNRDLIRGTGVTFGLPRLRAGVHVRLLNLGARFSGSYFVTSTTHTIGNGYQTEFTARREASETEATP